MKLPRRTFLHLAAGAAALPAMSRIARAQAYHADRHAGFFFNVINGFDSLTQSDLTVSVPVLVRLIGFRACTSLIANRSPFRGQTRQHLLTSRLTGFGSQSRCSVVAL